MSEKAGIEKKLKVALAILSGRDYPRTSEAWENILGSDDYDVWNLSRGTVEDIKEWAEKVIFDAIMGSG